MHVILRGLLDYFLSNVLLFRKKNKSFWIIIIPINKWIHYPPLPLSSYCTLTLRWSKRIIRAIKTIPKLLSIWTHSPLQLDCSSPRFKQRYETTLATLMIYWKTSSTIQQPQKAKNCLIWIEEKLHHCSLAISYKTYPNISQ